MSQGSESGLRWLIALVVAIAAAAGGLGLTVFGSEDTGATISLSAGAPPRYPDGVLDGPEEHGQFVAWLDDHVGQNVYLNVLLLEVPPEALKQPTRDFVRSSDLEANDGVEWYFKLDRNRPVAEQMNWSGGWWFTLRGGATRDSGLRGATAGHGVTLVGYFRVEGYQGPHEGNLDISEYALRPLTVSG